MWLKVKGGYGNHFVSLISFIELFSLKGGTLRSGINVLAGTFERKTINEWSGTILWVGRICDKKETFL